MAARLIAVILYTPTFLAPAVFIAVFGAWLGQMYMKSQLSIKREMSNAKAPVLSVVTGAISGLVSIRAYGAQDAFQNLTRERIDVYIRAARTFWNLNRWVAVRIDLLASLFSTGLAFYLVYGSASPDPSIVGFVLSMAVSFSDQILYFVRVYNEWEISGNSLERIQQYIDIEQEPEPKVGGTPPAYWPASGELQVEGLSARYSPDGPKVLEDVSFHVKAGERVGIVGRTGSGKSSLTLALLRCIYTEGTVYYDGVPTHAINLDALRSNVTIIPQVPELLAGTLRQNLDMFGEHDDAALNDALRAAGLFSLHERTSSDAPKASTSASTEAGPSYAAVVAGASVGEGSSDDIVHGENGTSAAEEGEGEARLTLDTLIADGGANLSVGQRQILALARAIVRRSKLLILDEATSAIDYDTDAVIQRTLRTELPRDATVLTVAHRLQTIMDSDKIMVLDAGRLVEFDSPRALLAKEGSFLRALVDESADREALYGMVAGETDGE
ncbi:hypothetical protein EIP86_005190 [Pleurotus ostreatoroseus]|nr:hypothetical protein EIP86_005190 [Pleurotus ostreatoroseus]